MHKRTGWTTGRRIFFGVGLIGRGGAPLTVVKINKFGRDFVRYKQRNQICILTPGEVPTDFPVVSKIKPQKLLEKAMCFKRNYFLLKAWVA